MGSVMTERFKAGDVVQLKSGGPKMTVSWIDTDVTGDPVVHCSWFDATGNEHTGNWPVPSLIKMPPESLEQA